MALPGFPDGPAEGWWRVEQATPPAYAATGNLAAGSTSVTGFAATHRGHAVTPLPGQLVAGTGIPAGAAVAADPAPSATSFTLTAAATAAATATALTMGAEPITLAEAKQWARILYSIDDNLVGRLIVQARRLIEGPELKRALVLQSRTLYFAAFPWGGAYGLVARGLGLNPWWFPTAQGVIQLPYPPLISVDRIAYTDTAGNPQTMDPTAYLYTANASPGRLQPQWGTTWPIARPQVDSVQITYTCGYGPSPADVPADVIIGLSMIVGTMYRNRESDVDYELMASEAFRRTLAGQELGIYS